MDEKEYADICLDIEGQIKAEHYVSVATGNKLERRPGMFYWRGVTFHGLVDNESNALYDDPEDSFASHVGIKSSIDSGLIRKINE